MVPMDEDDIEKIMSGKGEGGKKKEGGGGVKGTGEKAGGGGGGEGVPKGLGGFGVPERKKTVGAISDAASNGQIPKEVADEVAGLVEDLAVEESASGGGASSPSPPSNPSSPPKDGPMVMSPGQLGASPVVGGGCKL